jgi:peptide-methionine (S)-S-oxide reductase
MYVGLTSNKFGCNLEKSILQYSQYHVTMSEEKTIQADTKKLQVATFAAGCFWGIEEAFSKIKGVKSTMVGYTGGLFDNPTYRDVCTHKTGHAEAVQVTFDPNEVSYEDLLNVFWSIHNPTTKNRQGWDIGSQYRSLIAYHTPEQESFARESKEKLENSGKFRGRRIVTEIVPSSTFYKAEDYHQKYYQKRGGGSCYL